ncbi:N-acetylmuramic acid 6-phosphate etherase [Ensifer soli]|uniref:N-acetylmuramic acid 6-phosphate etherase n=1 Tax=Ciceribacter sp. sgz301302 TaxID=3342379 RepID=UPI0035B7BC3F
MPSVKTEERRDHSQMPDRLEPEAALRLLFNGQIAAARAVEAAIGPIGAAAHMVAEALSRGGRLAYAGAGSSGLMAMADALELPGTYGLTGGEVVILLAGGAESLVDLAGGFEDDADRAARDVATAGIGAGDVLISVSASGATPYALAAADAARVAGARIVAIANNRGARLFDGADVAILLDTPPEVVSGSTRMGAGTAQKIALNMLSTMAGIRLGHVHDGHMVNLRADNSKLHGRAARIVGDIAGVTRDEAQRHLAAASGSVKLAVLIAAGAGDATKAKKILDAAGQNLRRALEAVAPARTARR